MAILTDMGVNGTGTEILQPYLKNRFRVEFLGLESNEYLTMQVVTADRPKLSFEEVTLDRYNSRAYIAGKHTFETVNVTFECDVGGKVMEAIQSQLEHQQRLIGMGSAPLMPANRAGGRYKFTTNIKQLDGGNTVYELWMLEGCWFQNVDWGDLDYAASETIKAVATIRYDHARQLVTGDEYSAVVEPYGIAP